nr:MAG TPA: hypothetical protein [Bacteriophage sp.]DAT46499.1 MAG TPA: hypothetical protein [Caudoviricetes sp.]
MKNGRILGGIQMKKGTNILELFQNNKNKLELVLI